MRVTLTSDNASLTNAVLEVAYQLAMMRGYVADMIDVAEESKYDDQ